MVRIQVRNEKNVDVAVASRSARVCADFPGKFGSVVRSTIVCIGENCTSNAQFARVKEALADGMLSACVIHRASTSSVGCFGTLDNMAGSKCILGRRRGCGLGRWLGHRPALFCSLSAAGGLPFSPISPTVPAVHGVRALGGPGDRSHGSHGETRHPNPSAMRTSQTDANVPAFPAASRPDVRKAQRCTACMNAWGGNVRGSLGRVPGARRIGITRPGSGRARAGLAVSAVLE